MPGGPEGGGNGIYNEFGQVEDPEIAQEAAQIEKGARDRRGFFSGRSTAMRMAKDSLESTLRDKNTEVKNNFKKEKAEELATEIRDDIVVLDANPSFISAQLTFDGHKILFSGSYHNPEDASIQIDGIKADKQLAREFQKKYSSALNILGLEYYDRKRFMEMRNRKSADTILSDILSNNKGDNMPEGKVGIGSETEGQMQNLENSLGVEISVHVPISEAQREAARKAFEAAYDEEDRIDNAYIDTENTTEKPALFVTVNKGNVGSGALNEVIGL